MESEVNTTIPILAYIIANLFLMSGFLFQLELLYIAQLKEYKVYRLLDFVRSKKGRQQLLYHPFFIISVVAMVLQLILNQNIFRIYVLSLSVFWIYRILKRRIYRPVFTKKAMVLTGIAFLGQYVSGIFIGIILLTFFSRWNPFFSSIFLYTLFPVVWIFFWTQLLQIPTYLAKRYYIAKATKKLATYTNLRVVGITGSYGKTSTRNFLVQVLSKQYSVVTTPKNINTEIGIARFILDHDFSSDDVFVVEMGAYRKGEIKLIADMVRPEIGIITTIGPEHLALFGTMENIRDTKGELFNVLPKHGLAISHSDNSYCRELLKRAVTHTNVLSFGSVAIQHPNLFVSDVAQEESGIKAMFTYQGQEIEVQAPLYGTHHALNMAAVFMAAERIGMEEEAIILAMQTLTSPPHRLCRSVRDNNVVVLDDTYNSNPEGFLEALDLLSLQSANHKVVISRGMLELGSKEAEEHVRIGRRMGEVADRIIIISPDNVDHMIQGIRETNAEVPVETVYDMHTVADVYRGIIAKGDVAVLLENRVPQDMLDIR